jgi:hypothetical protein
VPPFGGLDTKGMTNPGGVCQPLPTVTNVEPLFPRGGSLDVRPSKDAIRDRQVWPRCMRELDFPQRSQTHHTAAIKHHLRKTAERNEMYSTYEHDFGFAMRPIQNNSANRSQTLGVTGRFQSDLERTNPLAMDESKRRMNKTWASISAPAFTIRDDGSVKSDRSRSSRISKNGGSATNDHNTSPAGTRLWATTEQKLLSMGQSQNPLNLNPRGWGGRCWTTTTHPHMIQGLSDKRIGLQQQANICNLRAPDIPFSTR